LFRCQTIDPNEQPSYYGYYVSYADPTFLSNEYVTTLRKRRWTG